GAAPRRTTTSTMPAVHPSECLANREIDLDPVLVQDLPKTIPHVEADRTDRRRDTQARAHAGVQGREREVGHLRRDHADVEERDAAEPAVDRIPPLEIPEQSQIAAERVTARVEGPDAVLVVASNGRAAARLETVLDHEIGGVAVGR